MPIGVAGWESPPNIAFVITLAETPLTFSFLKHFSTENDLQTIAFSLIFCSERSIFIF